MSEKRYSSKKYNDYPVIIDNQEMMELTLDSVVELLNNKEFYDKMMTQDYNKLFSDVTFLHDKLHEVRSQKSKLLSLLLIASIIIGFESLYIIIII